LNFGLKTRQGDTVVIISQQLQPVSQVYLLQAVIESFVDGILILTIQRELLHDNECAGRICRQLMRGFGSVGAVPEKVWRVCHSLIDISNRRCCGHSRER
jgi:hypothetical protein